MANQIQTHFKQQPIFNKQNLKLDMKFLKNNLEQYYQEDLKTSTTLSPTSLESNYQQFRQNYSKIKKIGEGMYSVVYEIKEKQSEKKLVAKITKNDEEAVQWQIEQEYNILQQLQHEGILKVEKFFKDSRKGIFVLICEFIDFPEAYSYKGNVEIEWLRQMLFSLLNILKYLHEKNIVHRDISSRNILVSQEGKTKLIDFGQVEKINNLGNIEVAGISKIAPPELFSDQKMDIWNTGMVVLELLQGKIISTKKVWQTIENCKNQWDQGLVEVLKKMITEYDNRASADELLQMDFFKKLQENH